MTPPRLELFHRLVDPSSARVRRYVRDQELEEQVRMRNVEFPEAQAEFQARGGAALPALWDGERLFEGAELIIARLSTLVDIGRSG